MLKLNLQGSLGRYGYSNLPDAIKSEIIGIAVLQAYNVAKAKAPYDPNDPPIHIRDDVHKEYWPGENEGAIVVKSPYCMPAEFGSKRRLAHPFMRPAAKSAESKIRSMLRKAAKEAAAEEKLKSGS